MHTWPVGISNDVPPLPDSGAALSMRGMYLRDTVTANRAGHVVVSDAFILVSERRTSIIPPRSAFGIEL